MGQFSMTFGVYRSDYFSITENFNWTEHPGLAKRRIWRSNIETSRKLYRMQQGGKSVVTEESVYAAVCRRFVTGPSALKLWSNV